MTLLERIGRFPVFPLLRTRAGVWGGGAAGAVLSVFLIWSISCRPSNDREWGEGFERVPRAERDGSKVTIFNVRNTPRWGSQPSASVYEDRAVDLDRAASLWVALSPFGGPWRGPAHVMLSFGFDDGSTLALSVESRREKGERYSLWRGCLRQYEILYVLAEERDLFPLRTDERGNDVFLYPVRADRREVRAMLEDVLRRVNALSERPEFYNTFFNSCASNLLRHGRAVFPGRLPWSWRFLLPGYADRLLHRLGVLDTDLSYEDARRRYCVTKKSRAAAGTEDYSRRIREEATP